MAETCPARYEPEQDRDALTHTCDLGKGHELDSHHCPRCGCYWQSRAGGEA